MELSEPTIHSFIIKILIENTTGENAKIRWHGQITHIPSNARSFFKDLSAISQFIASYLARRDELAASAPEEPKAL